MRCLVTTVLALVAGSSLPAWSQVTPAFPNLPAFDSPLAIAAPPDASDRLFVVERAGRVWVFDNDPAVNQRTVFLDIADSVTTQTEGGLLDLAFHPDYASNRYLFVTYTIEAPRRMILARFAASSGNPDVVEPGSEHRVLVLTQSFLHHKGGCVAFGPDGCLYLSLGDDGSAADAQDLTVLEGKLLRIDVDNPSGGLEYGIPPDNPFAGNQNGHREEIWAYGFRNPWRFAIDAPTGRLWLADVGQDTYEEVNVVRKGRNYGWPRTEGPACYAPPECDTTGLDIDAPLYTYLHNGSASITGGRVYRGPTQTPLAGKYVFADFITGAIGALDYDGVDPPSHVPIYPAVPGITSFGEDEAGELYFVAFDGIVYRFDAAAGVTPQPYRVSISAYPNPFRSSTTLEFELPAGGVAAVDIFDVKGRRVRHISAVGPGPHRIQWDGRSERGQRVPAGVYFGRLSAQGPAAGVIRIVRVR